jgi:hypothetical protein
MPGFIEIEKWISSFANHNEVSFLLNKVMSNLTELFASLESLDSKATFGLIAPNDKGAEPWWWYFPLWTNGASLFRVNQI